MNKRTVGVKGEDLAAAILEEKGYDILTRNYVTKAGEIDIIAKRDDTVIFCEVKTRTLTLLTIRIRVSLSHNSIPRVLASLIA